MKKGLNAKESEKERAGDVSHTPPRQKNKLTYMHLGKYIHDPHRKVPISRQRHT